MALYDKFKYAAAKYGASVPTNLRWGVTFDWDDDDVLDGTNEAPYLKGLVIERGRDYFISPDGSGFEPMAIGRASLQLDNSDGRYNPYNASSPLYPNCEPGRFVKIQVRDGATTYDLFSGVSQQIIPNGYNRSASIEAEDGIRWLSDNPVSTGIYEQTDAQTAIAAVLAAARWPALWGSAIDAGIDVLDYWWGKGRSALEEIRALSDAEIGWFYTDAAGQFVFRSRHNRDASAITITQDWVLINPAFPQPWEFRRNIVQVSSNPIAPATIADVWNASAEIALDGGASVEIEASLSGPAINLICEPGTDYTAYSQSDGAGDDLTSNVIVSVTANVETATLTISNTGTQLAYINLLKVRGNALESSTVSRTAYGTGYDRHPRALALDLEWQQDANNPAAFSSEILTFLNASSAFPVIQIENRPSLQFAYDLGAIVTVDLAAVGINSTFRIGKIVHEWLSETGQAVRTTWKLEPYQSYGYWTFPATFDTTTILGW